MLRRVSRALLASALVSLLLGTAFGFGQIPVGDHPRSIAVGDFNRDGWDDFAVANELSNDITICLAKGDGTFDCKVDVVKYDAYKPVIPMAIATGDLDNDGDLDLALAACGLTLETKTDPYGQPYVVGFFNIFTFKGKGDGTFSLDKKYLAGECPRAISLADLDRNGKLDIIIANSGTNDLTLFIDAKKKELKLVKDAKVCATPVALAVSDFNRDAMLDVAVACSEADEVWAFLGDGKGGLEVSQIVGVGSRPLDVKAGDLNRDAKPDLAVANSETNDVWTLFGDGTGKFTVHKRYRVDQAPSALIVQDFNGDCRLDIAVTNALANDVWILSGRPEGEFEAVAGKFAVGDRPVAIASGNFDPERDIYPDLAVANELTNDVTILLGIGAGRFAPFMIPPPNQPPVADFTWTPQVPKIGETVKFDGSASHDPDGQVVSWWWDFGDGTTGTGKTVEHVYQKENTYKVCLTVTDNLGAKSEPKCKDLTVSAVPPPPPPPEAVKAPTVGKEPSGLASGDFDGDGDEDLAVANQGSDDLSILLGNGQGKFSVIGVVAVGKSPSSAVAADFNKDNSLDLAVANAGSNTVSILLGDGKGGFQVYGEPAVGSNPMAIAAGDIDRDGNTDLAVANAGSNNVSILLGKGDGTFKEALNTEKTGESPEGLALGDLNGDGNPDLAVANLNSNDIAILLGNGDGTFSLRVKLSGLSHPREVVLEDFNGDGKLDLAVADSDSNTAIIFLGKGDGMVEEPGLPAEVGESPRALVAGHLNGDANLDLAVANYSGNNISILLGKGDGSFEEQRLFNVGKWPSDIIIGDFNGDANLDLAVANSGEDGVAILLGRGDGTFEDPPVALLGLGLGLGSTWRGVLVGGLGSLIFLPLLLWLWRAWTDEERRERLLARLNSWSWRG